MASGNLYREAIRSNQHHPSEEVGARFLDASPIGEKLRGLSGAAEREQQLSLELVRTQAELNRLRDIEIENQRLLRALGFNKPLPMH